MFWADENVNLILFDQRRMTMFKQAIGQSRRLCSRCSHLMLTNRMEYTREFFDASKTVFNTHGFCPEVSRYPLSRRLTHIIFRYIFGPDG